MPRRNSHPTFGIEIERGRALKHPEILFLYVLHAESGGFRVYFLRFKYPQINTFSHCRPL
jgi:hypothetical protein